MQKRTKIALVILFGLLLLLLGLWIFFQPVIEQRRAAQPPELTGGTPLVGRGTPQPTGTPTQPAATTTPPVVAPVDPMNALRNRAKAVVEQMGSGSNQNGFRGYIDAMGEMTTAGRVDASQQQAAQQKEHPTDGPTYTLSTRAVSSAVKEGKIGDLKIVINAEVIQTVNAGLAGATPTSSALRASVTFMRQADGTYLIDGVTWEKIDL